MTDPYNSADQPPLPQPPLFQPAYQPPEPVQEPAQQSAAAAYAYPYPYPAQQHAALPVAPAKRRWSGMAIAGFIVGLVVLGISLFSGYVIIAALPILWGIRAIIDVRRTGKRGMSLAVAGLVAGVISGILFLLSFFPG